MDAVVRLFACVVMAAALVDDPAHLSQTRAPVTGASARIERLAEWIKAAELHEPGTTDAWAARVNAWTNTQVGVLWIDANVLAQITRNPARVGFTVRPYARSRTTTIRYSPEELHRMRVLACAVIGTLDDLRCTQLNAHDEIDDELRQVARLAARSGDGDNDFLRRAAILHADVAMLMSASAEPVRSTGDVGPRRIRARTNDGLATEIGQTAPHWELARMLLDSVRPRGAAKPAPSLDEMVRRWYRATAAWMQLTSQYDTNHLDRARVIFPNDPDILFLSACQHETYAGPPIQSVLASIAVPSGVRLSVGGARSELRQAETLFRRALAARPAMAEARLRYGRVLSLLGRDADAAAELRKALASIDDRQLRYFGELFLGAVETARRDFDAAGDAYGRAAELYPAAQSPHIALSELARRRGDRAGALREMLIAFGPGGGDIGRADPWWSYFVAQARNADRLMEDLRRPFRHEP